MPASSLPEQQKLSTSITTLPSSTNNTGQPLFTGQPRNSRPTLETIPLEILLKIIELLDISDFRNIHASSRRLAYNTRPLLCQNINVTETTKSFQRMLSICSQDNEISRGVKSLTYIPFTIIRNGRETRELWALECGNIRGNMLFREYSALLKSRSAMAKNMSNVEYFTQALGLIKPLMINIVLPSRYNAGARTSHAHFLDYYNRIPACKKMLQLGEHCLATRSFIAILLALFRSKNSVQSIEAGTSLMFLLSPDIEKLCHAIRNLKRLHLTVISATCERLRAGLQMTHEWDVTPIPAPQRQLLDYIKMSEVTYDETKPQKWTFGRFITHATDLEELVIHHRHESLTFQLFNARPYVLEGGPLFVDDIRQLPLNGKDFPNLRTLALINIICTGAGLLSLFSQSKKLTHVELEDVSIIDLQDDWQLFPRFFSDLRTQIRKGRNALAAIKFYGWFDRVTRSEEWYGCKSKGRPTHMGERDGVFVHPHPPIHPQLEIFLEGFGKRMEDFVLGRTERCLWMPVPRDHQYNQSSTWKVFVDENFAQMMENVEMNQQPSIKPHPRRVNSTYLLNLEMGEQWGDRVPAPPDYSATLNLIWEISSEGIWKVVPPENLEKMLGMNRDLKSAE